MPGCNNHCCNESRDSPCRLQDHGPFADGILERVGDGIDKRGVGELSLATLDGNHRASHDGFQTKRRQHRPMAFFLHLAHPLRDNTKKNRMCAAFHLASPRSWFCDDLFRRPINGSSRSAPSQQHSIEFLLSPPRRTAEELRVDCLVPVSTTSSGSH